MAFAAASFAAIASIAGGFGSADSTSLLVVLCLFVVVSLMVLFRQPPWVTLVLLGSVTVVTAVLPGSAIDVTFLFGVFGFAAAVELRLKASALTVVGSALLVVLLSWWTSAIELTATLDGLALVIALTVTGSGYLTTFVRRVSRLDDVRLLRVEAEAEYRIRQAQEASDSNIRRLLHDELLGTIRAVTDADGDPVPVVTRACHEAIAAVASARQSIAESTLAEVVAWCVDRSRLRIDYSAADLARDAVLTPSQAEAVRRALAESLRNVERHAGVADATIRSSADEDWFMLEVTDAGLGVRGDSTRAWGVAHSIQAPIDAIGGRAEFLNGHHGGTRVVMRWPVPRPADVTSRARLRTTERRTMRAAGNDERLAMLVALPVLLAHSYLGVRNSWGDPHLWLELALGAGVCLGTVWLVDRLRRADAGPLLITTTSLGAAAAIAIGLSLAEADALRGHDSWIIGLTSVSLTMVAFFTPPPTGLASLVPSITVVGLHIAARGDALATAGALNAIVVPPVMAVVLGQILRAVGAGVDREENLLATLTADLHSQRTVTMEEQRQLDYLESKVVPWLARAADGALDAATRQEGQLLAAELRDELYLPGVLDEYLRARIWHRRSTGTRIDIEPPQGRLLDPVLALRTLDRLLDVVEVRRAALSLPTEAQSGAWSLSTFPAMTRTQLLHVLGSIELQPHEVTTDGLTSVVSVQPLINLPDPRRTRLR